MRAMTTKHDASSLPVRAVAHDSQARARITALRASLSAVLLAATLPVHAFKLDLKASYKSEPCAGIEDAGPGRDSNAQVTQWDKFLIFLLDSPIHEQMTHRTLCPKKEDGSGRDHSLEVDLREKLQWQFAWVLRGVRWPDDPTYEITEESIFGTCKEKGRINHRRHFECWAQSLAFAETTSKQAHVVNKHSYPLVALSHYLDYQALHAMGSVIRRSKELEIEPQKRTEERILTWAEFFYRMSLGEWHPYTLIDEMNFPQFQAMFYKGNGWRVGMFTDYLWGRDWPQARAVAFGSLLHTVQDSFASCHTLRADDANGRRVLHYFSFGGQSLRKHSEGDANVRPDGGRRQSPNEDWTALEADKGPNALTIGRKLFEMRRDGVRWDARGGPRELLSANLGYLPPDKYPTESRDALRRSLEEGRGRCEHIKVDSSGHPGS